MTSEGPVRADIRLVTTLLGQTLVRNEGQQLLDLVERVRAQVKNGNLADLREIQDLDLVTTNRLVRAFTSYFHLANITEQVHRGRELLRQRQGNGGWIGRCSGSRRQESSARCSPTRSRDCPCAPC